MIVSLFESARDNVPAARAVTWAEFVSELGPHVFLAADLDKRELPMWSPAEYPAGLTRLKENVSRVHAYVIDLDHASEAAALALLSQIEREGLSSVTYSTWSHAPHASPADWRLRVVLELSRPALPEEWGPFWEAVNRHFGHPNDEQTKDASRGYFGCFAPLGTEGEALFYTTAGRPLDVDAMLGLAPLPPELGPPAGGALKLTRERLGRFARRLERKSDEYLSELGTRLSRAVNGEAFAEPGERDNLLFKLCQIVGQQYPDHDPEVIARHFAPALQLMAAAHPDGALTVEDVVYKLGRAQEAARAAAQPTEDQRRARIREAFRNGRAEPYSAEELASFPQPTRWIVQRGASYYLFFSGRYLGPYSEADAGTAAVRDLAPAPVELAAVTPKGQIIRKHIRDLVAQYGTVADQVVLDMRAQHTTYDEPTRTVVEAPCPLRSLAPAYDPLIAQWFALLAGPRLQDLLTWVACVTHLESPCVSLFVTGPKHSGKSLLAHGLSRLWTTEQPTPLEDALANFNDSIARCPLVFADEQLPKDWRGHGRTAELRQFIQAVVRPFRRKFVPNATLAGAARVIVAANNDGVLSTSEQLTAHDIGAMVERYFHVPVPQEAADFLRSIGTAECMAWVAQDRIAAHALWLRDHHEYQIRGRFIIESPAAELQKSLTTRSGARSAVCQWLVGYLLDPGKVDHDAAVSGLAAVVDGELLVNTTALIQRWSHYVRNEPCPSTGHLSQALAALCLEGRFKHYSPTRGRLNVRKVDPEHLIAWAEQTGVTDREAIQAALQRKLEDKPRLVAANPVERAN